MLIIIIIIIIIIIMSSMHSFVPLTIRIAFIACDSQLSKANVPICKKVGGVTCYFPAYINTTVCRLSGNIH